MAGSYSDYLENKMLDHLFGGVSYPPLPTLYIALFTTAPSDLGGGIEVSAADYQRLAVDNNLTNWPAAVSGAKSNGTQFLFPVATNPWGTVVAFAIFDSISGGNMLGWADTIEDKIINIGDQASFEIGEIDITLS